MKKLTTLILMVFIGNHFLSAQVPTFADDIAPLLYSSCAACHNDNGIAPFPLITYQDAASWAFSIRFATTNRSMPPWPPDHTYQNFSHERVLTDSQITMIADWVNGGSPEGNPANTPPPPVFASSALLPGADIEMQIPTYTSTAFTSDDYVCIALDPGILTTKTIRAMEVIPGNRSIVHHCLVYKDNSGSYTPGNTYPGCTGPTSGSLIGGYTPGSGPLIFPNSQSIKMGMDLLPNDVIVLAMHYPVGSSGMKDSTKVNLHFYPDGTSGVRQISADPIIQHWSFCIPADSVREVSRSFTNNGSDISLLSVFPHCHLLGQSWEVYALDALGDTIRMIRINDWDFDWQDFYFFDYVKKLPIGSTIHAKCVYNNTTLNQNNPNTPPQQVCAGLNTADEMMLVYFHYLQYEPGDEYLNLDSMMEVPVSVGPVLPDKDMISFAAFPNPASGPVTLDYYLPEKADVVLEAFDLEGRKVEMLWRGRQAPGQYQLYWESIRFPAGTYIFRLTAGESVLSRRVIVVK